MRCFLWNQLGVGFVDWLISTLMLDILGIDKVELI
jgi:hypothetical protein